MEELLFLAHRIPYPPDKGDKIRSWNFLKHLSERYRVNLGAFIDDPRDWAFADTLRGICRDCCLVNLSPKLGRIKSLRGFLDGSALTVPYYANATLRHWVRGVLARRDLTRVFVFCSSMAPYIPVEIRRSRRCVADLVDVDSEKWLEYARMKPMTTAWLWAREGRLLRNVEHDVACSFDATVVATAAERELLQSFAPEARSRIFDVPNGVDSDYFSPDRLYEAPPEMSGTPLVFTGAMDYWPNADAAIHFARTILPGVLKRIPDAKFFVVGANPTAEVSALADGKQIIVTGRVPDIRPYVANAKAVVAPLRVARGVQNKVLEGMAMARPVVASPEAAVGIEADIGEGIVVAGEPAAFAEAIFDVAGTPAGEAIGRRGRQRVMADHVWSRSLARLDEILDA